MLSKILKYLLKLTLHSEGVGVKRKNKKEIEGYYYDGERMHILYKRKS